MSGKSMANKVISKVNARLKFLHRKNKYLTPNLRRLLCKALIQRHFDYACSAWYPNLSKNQNSNFAKQMHSFLFTVRKNITYISKRIWNNWLPIKERYNQCVNSIALKYFDNQCSHYSNEVVMKAPKSSSALKNSYQNFPQPFRKTNTGQTW